MIAQVLAFACGALQVASYSPFGWWWLQPLSLAGLVGLAWRVSPRRAAGLGFVFGWAWFCTGLWWLFISLHEFGGLWAPWAALAVALLAAFLALYPAAALAGFAALGGRPAWRVLVFASAWTLADLARAQWFTGFPWLAGGYAHTEGPLAAWASWLGVYGIGALSAAWGAGVAAWVLAPRKGRVGAIGAVAVASGLVLGGAALPQDFTRPVGTLSLTLLQPNVPQSQKFDPVRIDANLQALLAQIEAASTPLVVTPESVVPLPLAFLKPEPLQRLLDASTHRTVWVGTFLGSDDQGWVNSMLAMHRGQPVHEYGKRHLLPFGEFIPPGLAWFVKALNIPIDSQVAGTHQRPLVVQGLRLRPLICYEDLFGEDVVASAVAGPDAADVFVNTSNLAWFGVDMVQDQHLQFSQMRALEFQRPVVRATNTGATAHVDHGGRVLTRLAPATQGALVVTVQGRQGSTPYARWLHATGLWPLWGLALAPLAWGALRQRYRPQRCAP